MGTHLIEVVSSDAWLYAAPVAGIVNSATAVTIKAAAGAGVKNFLGSLEIDNDALGAATIVAIRDGAAGTVLWRGRIPALTPGERSVVFNPPLVGSANTLLEALTLTAVTGAVWVNAQGYVGT